MPIVQIKPNMDDDDDQMDLTLRPIALSDVDDFMRWATDDRVSKLCLWSTYTSRDQALDYIQNQAIPHPWLRAICVQGRVVGTISVTPAGGLGGECRANIGYCLAYDYWGKGITTRAVKMATAAVFREWRPAGLRRIEGIVEVENKASQRVLEKAGFVREGVLTKYIVNKGRVVDVVIFGLIQD